MVGGEEVILRPRLRAPQVSNIPISIPIYIYILSHVHMCLFCSCPLATNRPVHQDPSWCLAWLRAPNHYILEANDHVFSEGHERIPRQDIVVDLGRHRWSTSIPWPNKKLWASTGSTPRNMGTSICFYTHRGYPNSWMNYWKILLEWMIFGKPPYPVFWGWSNIRTAGCSGLPKCRKVIGFDPTPMSEPKRKYQSLIP